MERIKKIVIATRNPDKFEEIKKILNNLPVEFISLPEGPSLKEDGKNLEENAIKKAEASFKLTGEVSLADDTGLEVDLLNGAPGIYSARFAGPRASYADNRKKLLLLLKSKKERTARFRCIVAIAEPGKTKIFEGKIQGYITEEERGEFGFGYDSIFLVPELSKTFAEISPELKNKISHRGLALLKAKEYIKSSVQ
ncbi:RdgB/HAM1 family non-canonical purine NTP pyrophosphatase [candidate division WOR-3 bacterium]|nr:RdgB/HAM1 family non-canonical purine NTP pyrophosphatase [candidate division WOR-3 bacterium]